MAQSGRSANTMAEQLRGLLSQIAEMKAAPDADIAYLTNLETQVLRYLRAPYDKARLEAQLGGPVEAAQDASGQMGGGGRMPPMGPTQQLLFGNIGAPAPQGVPGVMQGHSMPNADELRRLMEQPAL